ncbi:hypothetical protein McanMca71_007131 [Microsporum canis]|uniref:GRIP domain-containing protein n=1 Tax=Arthroderma otae (strain ATCC MYA-4605 / CBS 113480) TaxID=554155 RepID=C5FFC7_ARTOC|nr:conserved hypothetical protein [Microsporum canis CBS 113480]EEQ28511.1 conserved hypothetical protein [Microsporum canis CBS 113480]
MPANSAPAGQAVDSKSKKKNKKKGGKAGAQSEKSENTGAINADSEKDGRHEEQADMEPDHATMNGSQEAESTTSITESLQDLSTEDQGSRLNKKQPSQNKQINPKKNEDDDGGADDRFSVLVRDRDSLREEVIEMRRSLEEIQSKHDEEMETIQERLRVSESQKEQAESQFHSLLGRVNTIKSQLGERLKADAEELTQKKTQIEEYESANAALKAELEVKSTHISSLERDREQQSKELSSLRNRINLTQQNWVKEREELLAQESELRTEFEEAKQAMHSWEIIAMEERSIRESLGEKVIDLDEQLSTLKTDYDKVTSDYNSQGVAVEGLQKALREIQSARKQELRELVESTNAQVEEVRKKLEDAEKRAAQANAALEETQKNLERALPFEKEVKEKNLLIGKLRHEAVTLNEHLTKALRFLKKGKPEDNVDRNLVTNHFLHFLSLDRSDPKKFQILQLIAALLAWDDEQREQAGLARPGASGAYNNLRAPRSPSVFKTPSSPSLATGYFGSNTDTRKESLAELWSNFLEQEAQTEGKLPQPGTESPLDKMAS